MNANQTLSFKDNVKVVFRFRFGADYTLENSAWAVDDFCFRKTNRKVEHEIGEGE
ncbi:MAG: hypothetical protein U5L96_05580 [Owenweeksia sp.]|nr:hypothetical protein [Owenweeksia sp.]